MNTGKDYELFVAGLQKALLDTDIIAGYKNIAIERNKKLKDNNGIFREFDLYWEYELGGITYKTVIECKDYKNNVSVERIDALIGKIKDLPDLKALFATRKGYQKGARIKAEKNKIDLLIVREQNNDDWIDDKGNPFIKKMVINLQIMPSVHIIGFHPKINKKWIKQHNIRIDIGRKYISDMKEILIEDIDLNKKYTIYDVVNELDRTQHSDPGKHEITREFNNAFISIEEKRVKLDSFKIDYQVSEPMNIPFEIDYTKELIGVIEYLNKGKKKSVFKNGIIIDSNI